MEKSNQKIITYILIILVAVVFVYLGYAFGKKIPPFGESKYQAIQFSSGEVYYGKLQMFPCCKISDVYFIQQDQTGSGNGTQLVPFTSMFFSPENAIYFDRSQILWWTNLSSDSQIVQAIKSQNTTQQTQQQNQESQQNQQNTQTTPQSSENLENSENSSSTNTGTSNTGTSESSQ